MQQRFLYGRGIRLRPFRGFNPGWLTLFYAGYIVVLVVIVGDNGGGGRQLLSGLRGGLLIGALFRVQLGL